MPKSMHIPCIGETFELAEPWTFTLHDEYRNKTLIHHLDPAHFELKVTRVYIRQHQEAYNSVTFTCPYNGTKVRFWVKLKDANKIVMVDHHE